jgi:hypothetical protein
MELQKLTGGNAIDEAMELVAQFLDDPDQRVIFVTGRDGIGKRTALSRLFAEKNITPKVFQNFPRLDDESLIEKQLLEFPTAVHLWGDAFETAIMQPLVHVYLKKVANGKTSFRGKMIIIANDLDFSNYQFPELPGVWIEMDNTAMLDYIEKRIKIEHR